MTDLSNDKSTTPPTLGVSSKSFLSHEILEQKNAQIKAMKKYISHTLQNDKVQLVNTIRLFQIAVYDGVGLTINTIRGKTVKQAICMYISQYWPDDRIKSFYQLTGNDKLDKGTTMFLVESDIEISEEKVIQLFEEEYQGQFCIFK